MKIFLRLFWTSLIIVFGFWFLLHLPWGLLPFSDAVNVILVGFVLLAFVAYYTFYHYRREGWDFGWFLSKRAGLWMIGVAVIGLVMVGCGLVLFTAPDVFLPAFEQGALPFGIVLVSSFWLSLIFIFGFLSVNMVVQVVVLLRVGKFIEAVISFLIVLVCVGPAAICVSLFLQVLNDIAIRISEGNQWIVIRIVIGLIWIAGVVAGCVTDPKKSLDNKGKKNI
jgi:hypothetical protein